MGGKCELRISDGGGAFLGPEKPFPFSKNGLCARCYRRKHLFFPWKGDPRDEIGHPECLRNPDGMHQ
jgi:hypothetical protein